MPTQKNLQHKYVPQIDSKSFWKMVVRIDQYNSVHHDSMIFSITIGTGWRAGINNLSKKGLGMKKKQNGQKCAEISRNAEILCWGTRKKIMLRRGLNLFEEYLESKIEMNLHKSGKTALIS